MASKRENNIYVPFSSNHRAKLNKNEEKDIPQRRSLSNYNRNRHAYNNISSLEDSIDFTNITSIKSLMNNRDVNKILTIMDNNIEKYSEIFINKLDYDVLTNITNLNKMVCSSNLITKKFKVLQTTINEDFFKLWNVSISTHILELHSSSWWMGIQSDWNTLLILFEECLDLIPSTSWPLIQKTLKLLEINSDLIEKQKHMSFSKDFKEKLLNLIQKTDKFENAYLEKNNKKTIVLMTEPEGDYRIIGLFPHLNELISPKRNFIRKNIVIGPYKDIAQYLDIHFRLLREDFLNPLREDISDYLKGVNRRFFNIKVIDNIKFIEKSFNKNYVCYTLEINMNYKLQNSFQNNKKRLIPGTLLIFSNDEFKSILCGVVVDCNRLVQGRLLVSFEATEPNIGTKYKMIECTIFFEPYYQVLKVLQSLSQKSLSMSKYLINVETSVSSPVLTNRDIAFYDSDSDSEDDFVGICESVKKLNISIALNATQKVAFNAACSQEFVIIQGPPGTGKTYLGIQITKSLLKKHNGPILIVCYTNHALDQFLESLVDYTNRLVRFGSQSKSMKLEDFTLYNRRSLLHKVLSKRQNSYELRRTFKQTLIELERQLELIDSLIPLVKKSEGIISFDIIKSYAALRNSHFEEFTKEEFLFWLLQEHPTKNAVTDFEEINIIYSDYFKEDTKTRRFVRNRNYSLDINSMVNAIGFIRNELKDIKNEKANFISKFATDDPNNVKKGKENIISKIAIDDPNYVQAVLGYDTHIQFLERNFRIINEKLTFLETRLKEEYNPNIIYNGNENPFDMNYEIRWQKYKLWLRQTEQALTESKERLLIHYRDMFTNFTKEDNKVTVEVLKNTSIVGMTSTCAARMHGVLEEVGFQIVIVEEAAEVLEAHILPLLTKHCKHLILLGDHQQLKPSTSDYIIRKDFNLGVSLFERMVNNGIQCNTLNVQHRMRPEIADLISPAIYPKLENHQSVYKYAPIIGISKSLFFIDHNNPEENFGDSSKCNKFEAKFLIKLAEYLINVGYSPENITILAAYLGQVATIQKDADFSLIGNIKVTAVDNFQGEENDIILLSLVRNNIDKNVGFLSIENRICVALSRAKKGLYILGNMKMLCEANKVWKSINDKLTSQEAIGPSLPLKCMHGTITTYIKTPEDFQKNSNAGCDKDCDKQLVCGHKCQQKCHLGNLNHLNYECSMPCLLCICETHGELCKKICGDICDDCLQEVTVTLPCQHEKTILCHISKSPKQIVCNQEVTVKLPCGHNKNVECYSKNDLKNTKCIHDEIIELPCGHMVEKSCQTTKENVKCTNYCKTELLCGHKCILNCHINIDPDHKNYICQEVCLKINLNCSQLNDKHTSRVACGKKPSLCNEEVKKIRIACQHCFPKIECHVDVNANQCTRPCKKTLPCTHICTNKCSDKCGPCTKKVSIRSDCGHLNNTVCGTQLTVCNKECDKKMKCGHTCPRNCSEPCSMICCRCKYFEETNQ